MMSIMDYQPPVDGVESLPFPSVEFGSGFHTRAMSSQKDSSSENIVSQKVSIYLPDAIPEAHGLQV
jgi:hypothetical protein